MALIMHTGYLEKADLQNFSSVKLTASKQNMENMRDTKGRTLASYVAREVAMIHKRGLRTVKLRRGETRCCRELPI